jgi:CobQ-like glutamine amidotransferase family enzyme
MTLHLVHLYPDEMNTYGDRGNRLTLLQRARWRGLDAEIHFVGIGDELPAETDLVLGGGGQDSAQADIQADVLRKGDRLHELVQAGVPMLMVCGTYQLLGRRFLTHEGEEIAGIGVFDVETVGGDRRLIGNAAVQTEAFGTLYGFENHSGRTVLGAGQESLGRVLRGNGNNGEDGTEGARTGNAIGTYLHGPLLPANPVLADALLALALARRGEPAELAPIDEPLVERSRAEAARRPY